MPPIQPTAPTVPNPSREASAPSASIPFLQRPQTAPPLDALCVTDGSFEPASDQLPLHPEGPQPPVARAPRQHGLQLLLPPALPHAGVLDRSASQADHATTSHLTALFNGHPNAEALNAQYRSCLLTPTQKTVALLNALAQGGASQADILHLTDAMLNVHNPQLITRIQKIVGLCPQGHGRPITDLHHLKSAVYHAHTLDGFHFEAAHWLSAMPANAPWENALMRFDTACSTWSANRVLAMYQTVKAIGGLSLEENTRRLAINTLSHLPIDSIRRIQAVATTPYWRERPRQIQAVIVGAMRVFSSVDACMPIERLATLPLVRQDPTRFINLFLGRPVHEAQGLLDLASAIDNPGQATMNPERRWELLHGARHISARRYSVLLRHENLAMLNDGGWPAWSQVIRLAARTTSRTLDTILHTLRAIPQDGHHPTRRQLFHTVAQTPRASQRSLYHLFDLLNEAMPTHAHGGLLHLMVCGMPPHLRDRLIERAAMWLTAYVTGDATSPLRIAMQAQLLHAVSQCVWVANHHQATYPLMREELTLADRTAQTLLRLGRPFVRADSPPHAIPTGPNPLAVQTENAMQAERIAHAACAADQLEHLYGPKLQGDFRETLRDLEAFIGRQMGACNPTPLSQRLGRRRGPPVVSHDPRSVPTEAENALRVLSGDGRHGDYTPNLMHNPSALGHAGRRIGLGRLAALNWLGITTYTHPDAGQTQVCRDLMLTNLVLALAESIDDDRGHRVCEVGLLERLAVPMAGYVDGIAAFDAPLPASFMTGAAQNWAVILGDREPTLAEREAFATQTALQAAHVFGLDSHAYGTVRDQARTYAFEGI